MDYQDIIFQIIVNGGDAKSYAMQAIKQAKAGSIDEAKKSLKSCSESLEKAHNMQTGLIQEEAAGNAQEVTLLMVHAQDHFMNAMTVRDLAQEFIDMYESIADIKKLLK
ncbi:MULTISPECIES: PTS lactose/cellobiose transporter subunit IIA [Clostridium]|jgi:PTS system cellobiose-specific IIA component|uniref:Phosphotransferase system PTS lactose/cellobiose-specific transporter IIA subunit n=2 Tax=Clostridium intestinale TaxID=36845 RepID=U2PPR0_9CLOT|nr:MULTISPECIES: PTS lactose/cellobiose transporter subunit IIA [Clostridium]ERK28425.1 phosphotransferase system PTS lactose/cellobiose-specific transporter IIA subunit [Clostridium intestinale URNW]WRY50512.1 PTS lactose/cellobiose transporter subunit IIA [Clostridium intestinale]SHI93114.1 PTS system, cellobiose-specific IIA component [Clostridium intestinale DSM 6191]